MASPVPASSPSTVGKISRDSLAGIEFKPMDFKEKVKRWSMGSEDGLDDVPEQTLGDSAISAASAVPADMVREAGDPATAPGKTDLKKTMLIRSRSRASMDSLMKPDMHKTVV
jgi:hypothetical protein